MRLRREDERRVARGFRFYAEPTTLKPAGGFLGFSASFAGQKIGKCPGSGVKCWRRAGESDGSGGVAPRRALREVGRAPPALGAKRQNHEMAPGSIAVRTEH